MIVIDGPANNGIAESVAAILNLKTLRCHHKIFSDGESEVGIGGSVKGEDVVIFQSTYPMQDKRLQELLFMAHDASEGGARSIQAVVPYLAYARQNKKYKGKNNAVSIDAVLKVLNAVGITTLITVAPHKIESLSAFKGTIKTVDAVTPLAQKIKERVSEPFVLAPDKGALKIAERFAEVLGCSFSSLDKKRDTVTGEIKILNKSKADFSGKEVVIADDMISTGGTTAEAAKLAYDCGAKRVIAAAVHLLMVEGAYQRLADAGVEEIYGTNTIASEKAHVVDVSGGIAGALGNGAAAEEYIDEVDGKGNFVAKRKISELKGRMFMHKVALIVPKAEGGRIILSKRANKSPFPNTWCCAVGGKVSHGETEEEAAAREMREEVGRSYPLRRVSSFVFDTPEYKGIFTVFTTKAPISETDFVLDPAEIQYSKPFSKEEVRKMVKENSRAFAPTFIAMIKESMDLL